jgi:serine protease Do
MKKLLMAATAVGFMSFCNVAFAQNEQGEPKKDKKTEEIIIRNKGDKDMNMTVQINGDSVFINGKPLDEFTDSLVSIKKRKMVIRDGDRTMAFDFDNSDFERHMEDMAKHQEELAMQREHLSKKFDEENFRRDKEMNKPFLGVKSEKDDKGAKVVEIVPASAAEKAGLKEGDIITKVNDKKIDGPEMLSEIVSAMKPKDNITVSYIRNKKQSSTKAILGEHKGRRSYSYSFVNPPNPPEVHAFEMPELPDQPDLPEIPEFNFNMEHHQKLGLKIQDTDDGTVKVIGVEDSSTAAKAGLQKDDIITEIDGEKINNTDEAREQLHPEEDKKSYDIKVLRKGTEMNFNVKIPRKLKTADL